MLRNYLAKKAAQVKGPQWSLQNRPMRVISRGNHREMIFHNDSGRNRYLSLLAEVQNRYSCKLYAYVLMGNHVHLLVEAGVALLSKIMQNLRFRYTRYYNLRYRKTGHLFEGRYKAILC